MSTLRLYDYAASCNCYKARLVLAQLGLEYERVPIDIFAGDTLTDEFARINPARTTPVLETEYGYLPESNAIITYLAAGTPMLPEDPFERAQVVGWLVFEQTDVIPTMGGLRFRLQVGRLTPDDPAAIQRKEGSHRVLRLLDDHLSTRESSSPGAIRSPTSPSMPTRTLRTRRASTWSRTQTSGRGSPVWQEPGYMNDVAPYGANAAPGAGRSIYE